MSYIILYINIFYNHLYLAENYKESYEAYAMALQWLTDNQFNMANVLCAMAAMAYMFQESNAAKTLLFQAVKMQPQIIPGLLPLATLGILDNDEDLTFLVLKELKLFDSHPDYKHHIAKLSAYSILKQNDTEGAARILCKYIHKYPGKER